MLQNKQKRIVDILTAAKGRPVSVDEIALASQTASKDGLRVQIHKLRKLGIPIELFTGYRLAR